MIKDNSVKPADKKMIECYVDYIKNILHVYTKTFHQSNITNLCEKNGLLIS